MQEPTASPTKEAPLPVEPEEKVIAEPDEAIAEPEAEPEPEAEEGKQEPEPEPPTPPAFDPDTYADNAEFQSYREGLESKAHRQGQIREAGQRKQNVALLTQVNTGMESLTRVISDAVKAGALSEDSFRSIMQENAPTLAAYGEAVKKEQLVPMRQHNMAFAKAGVIADVANLIEAPELVKEYIPRLVTHVGNDPQNGQPYFFASDEYVIEEEDPKSGTGGTDALTDFFKAAFKVVDKKGFDRGVRSRDGTASEREKASEREGKGPGEVKGSGGGHKPYADLTRKERQKLAEEGRVDQYTEQHG